MLSKKVNIRHLTNSCLYSSNCQMLLDTVLTRQVRIACKYIIYKISIRKNLNVIVLRVPKQFKRDTQYQPSVF